MGRQAYITRLALGRSPYEAPVLSESGEFILGPYAHEFDNTDNYTQQYDERGHPDFRASRTAAREFRRAKNDVLSTVGVVYKKAEPSQLKKKNDGDLLGNVPLENLTGCILFITDNFLMVCSLWWLLSLRMKVEAFRSYSIPVVQIMKSELAGLGTTRYLFAGLPACLLPKLSSHGIAIFLLYYSVKVCGTWQSLHLIPAGRIMSFRSLISFIRHLPIQVWSNLYGVLTSPVFLLWVYMSLNRPLQSTLEKVIRSITTKPDKPDRVSCRAMMTQELDDAETLVPGLREPPWTLSDIVKSESSKLEKWFKNLLKPIFGRRRTSEDGSSHLPVEVAVTQPAQPAGRESDCASTTTPDPEDLFDMADVVQQTAPERAESDFQPLSRANTLFTPLNQSPATTPPASPRVRASLIHRDTETVTMQLELLESRRETVEELPNQRHDVLGALEELANVMEDVGDRTSAEAEAAAVGVPERDEGDSEHEQQQIHQPRHRVTALSNFASNAFASHATCLLTSTLLLPLETLFVRSLALAFLGSSSLARDVRPLFSWPDGQYTSTLLGLLGLQALVSSVVWGFGTGVAIGLGRMKYQWGRL